MTATALLKELTPIFEEVLDVQGLELRVETTANDIAEWDSVSHLILLHAIEEHFNCKFDLNEIINFRQVGDICTSLIQKKG